MTVKISGAIPKEAEAFNGLEVHREDIIDIESLRDPDAMGWSGYAVVQLSVKEIKRGRDGEWVPTVQVDRIEVMEGARVEPARRALLDTFRERTTDGVVDPVQPNLFDHSGSDFLRHGSGVVVSGEDRAFGRYGSLGVDFDPDENPDEAPETHHGVPVERVELPAEDVERLSSETDAEYAAAGPRAGRGAAGAA